MNKIHFILASQQDRSPITEELRTFIAERASPDLQAFESYWEAHAKPSRYDGPEIIFIKRMLQHALPDELRFELLDRLFNRFVSIDPVSFAAELYVSRDQLKEMIESGMYVGSHGDKHCWLNQLNSEEQVNEIDRSLAFLKDLGAAIDEWIMCYPYGGHDASLREHLRNRSCAAGLTVRGAVASIGVDDPLMLPRIDTNDLPIN